MPGRDPFANPEQLLRRVYAYVAYRVGNRADAEDITSDTFERALRYRDSFDSKKGDPIAWLLGIAGNCIYTAMLRPQPVAATREEASLEDLEASVVTRLGLAEALATLTPRDRELLALRYGAELKPREIAALLDQRTNAVEVALTRARARLAAAYEGLDAPVEPRAAPLVDVPNQGL